MAILFPSIATAVVGWVERSETQRFIAKYRWVDETNPTYMLFWQCEELALLLT